MRHPVFFMLLAGGVLALAGCQKNDADVARAMKSVNAIDETNLSDIMLTVGDPNEAVAYFKRSADENPDRIDLRRGLAKSLVRAGRPAEAARVWAEVIAMPGSDNEDRVQLADAQIRGNDWKGAEATLNQIPPTHETYQRYRLEAMVADANKNWAKADSFYETAAGLTTKPGGVLNNWGFSKLTRGDAKGAEKLFAEALTHDPRVFTTKNNLVLARAAQRKYDMPVIDMSQTERAQLLYTAALSAIKQGDVAIGKGLLQEAVDTHPQHFEEAARALAALDANVAKG
ncbi:tetratricopeptide repeat protein [Phaeovulum sp. NW3]|uniref:tetratricopeptide repeat protein n=1 Tax=Phaeovulum sp. NW3 TaxID=2934933 RepID=UPI0020212BBD|nr:tetratricopeptide repeat protein [Phaeovulum sp. NW3]MCL7463699.1 tetratricopeptide repeat protein [Phaeovulum sp. NW3]